MEYLITILLKCKKSFILVLILSIMNASISFGMTTELEEKRASHIARTQLSSLETVQEDEESSEGSDEVTLGHSLSNISREYVLAFRNESEERGSKFLIFKKVAGILGGILVCIPQIDVAIGVGDYYGSKTLGYGLVGLTFLSGGGIASWITSEFIEDTHTLVEKVKKRGTISSCYSMDTLKEIKFGILSLVIGSLSSCSDVYKTYKYNTIKELSIITFVFDVMARTLGLYKTFTSLSLTPISRASQEQNILKKTGAEYIDLSKRNFLNICKRDGVESVSKALADHKTPNDVYSYLTSSARQNPLEELFSISSNNYEKSFPRKVVMGGSLIFPVSSAIFDMVMAYKGYNLFIDNPVALIFLTGVSVLPTSALNTYVTTRASDSISYKFYLFKNGLTDPDYFSTFQPYINKALFISSLFLGSTSSIAGFAIISDNMEGTLFSPIKYLVATVGVASGLIFGTYTITSTMKGYGEEIAKKCSKGASYIFGCLKRLGEVSNSIFTSSVDTVSDFINQITSDSINET